MVDLSSLDFLFSSQEPELGPEPLFGVAGEPFAVVDKEMAQALADMGIDTDKDKLERIDFDMVVDTASSVAVAMELVEDNLVPVLVQLHSTDTDIDTFVAVFVVVVSAAVLVLFLIRVLFSVDLHCWGVSMPV